MNQVLIEKLFSSVPYRVFRKARGAALVEYAILLGLISILAIGGVLSLGKETRSIFDSVDIPVGTWLAGGEGDPLVPPFVRCSGPTAIESSTVDIDVSLCGEVSDGDLMVAFITHRSALSLPDGWTAEMSQRVGDSGEYDQWLTVTTKPYAQGDASSFTFTQSDSNRMLGHIQAIGGDDPQVARSDSRGDSGSGRENYEKKYMPEATYAGDGALLLGAVSEVYTETSGPMDVTVSPGWTMTTPASVPGNRLGVAWTRAPVGSAGASRSRDYFTSSADLNEYATAIVQITDGGQVRGPAESGYDVADVQPVSGSSNGPGGIIPDAWMRLKEAVEPNDPADTHITFESMLSVTVGDYVFVRSNYPRQFHSSLVTRSDASGYAEVSITRGSYYLSDFPAGEEGAIFGTEVGMTVWIEFLEKPGTSYAFVVTHLDNQSQINIGRQAIYYIRADFIGEFYDGDPSKLRYDDGEWYVAP